jgi:hypothetical protein
MLSPTELKNHLYALLTNDGRVTLMDSFAVLYVVFPHTTGTYAFLPNSKPAFVSLINSPLTYTWCSYVEQFLCYIDATLPNFVICKLAACPK